MANKLESEIAKSFRTIAPSPDENYPLQYIYTKLVVNKTSLYGIKTPCDALVDCRSSKNLALELKELAVRGSFPFSRLPVHQEQGLVNFQDIGRDSYIIFCFRKNPKDTKPVPKVWAMPIHTYLQLKEQNLLKGRVSLSAEQIETESIPVVKTVNVKGLSIWNISVL